MRLGSLALLPLVCSSWLQAQISRPPTRVPLISCTEPAAEDVSHEEQSSALDAAFTNWHEEQLMQREVNRVTQPDVPLWLVFENIAQPTTIAGSTTTDALHREACRLHNLASDMKLRFSVRGTTRARGVAMSETPLASTKNLQVRVDAAEWPVKRLSREEPTGAPRLAAWEIRRARRRNYNPVDKLDVRIVQHCMAGWEE